MRRQVRLTCDRLGTPAVWAEDMLGAMWGEGAIHAHLRPVQTLLAHTAARGELRRAVGPLPALKKLDALAARLDIDVLARRAYQQLCTEVRAWLDAYTAGFNETLAKRGTPGLVAALRMKLPPLEPQGVLRLLLLISYLGQVEGQSRMELSVVALAREGARPELIEALFGSLVDRTTLQRAAQLLPRQSPLVTLQQAFASSPSVPMGSNAWAAHGSHTQSGRPLLAGDPHLAIHELPAALLEFRARIGDNFWLGASIPGLCGLFVGRNRYVAFSGTFAFADTVDWVLSPDAVEEKSVANLCEHTGGARGLAKSLEGYLRLAMAKDAREALLHIAKTETLSLTFVVADIYGEVHRAQAGMGLVRSPGSMGLLPYLKPTSPFVDDEKQSLPTSIASAERPFLVSANEGDVDDALVGTIGWSLPQPSYRKQRIEQLLATSSVHTIKSFMRMQCDTRSLQGEKLGPLLCDVIGPSSVRTALLNWDADTSEHSVGAHAFDLAYRQALRGLAPHLGNSGWLELLEHTEMPLWWARALDALLVRVFTAGAKALSPLFRDVFATIEGALSACASMCPEPWGNTHRLEQRHSLLQGFLGAKRRARPWSGSLASVQQASSIRTPQGTVAIGQAYRFVTDLAADTLYSTLPGGQDERPWHPSYACFVAEYHRGDYHRLAPPTPDEAPWT